MSLPDPKTRREVYLNSIANGESVDLTPHTREEVYLDAIANNGGGSGGGTTVVANPELAGTEADLTGLQVGDTKYKVPSGGGGGTLVCNADQSGTIDHTWQDIHDAGFAVLELPMDENETAIYFASKISVLQKMGGGTLYMVTFVAIADDGTVTAFAFGADSADGYPVIQQG